MNKTKIFFAWQDALSSGVNYTGTALAGYNAITSDAKKSDIDLENLAHNAVYGNSQADPFGRFVADVSGASVEEAKDKIGDVTNLMEDANVGINGSSAQDIVRASYNIDTDLPEKLERLKTTKGLGWKTALSTALGAPWLDFDDGIKLDTDNLQASAQGAQNGSSFGPWGMLLGGIAGGLFNLGSRFGRNKRANKVNESIDEYNEAIDTLRDRRRTALSDANDALQRNNFRNLFATRAAYGGPLSFTGDFSNGMTYFGTGGTHEQNEYGGIQQGVAPDGNPNLVEEGEWKWDDANYIFSNRIKIPKYIQEKYNLAEGLTFADAAGKLSQESEERPNDPISKNGLTAFMSDLAMAQEEIKAKRVRNKVNKDYNNMVNSFPYGGNLTLQDLDEYLALGTLTNNDYNTLKSIVLNEGNNELDDASLNLLRIWDPDGYIDYQVKQQLRNQVPPTSTRSAAAPTYTFDRPLSYTEMEDLLHTDPAKYDAYVDWMNSNPQTDEGGNNSKKQKRNWNPSGNLASVAPIVGSGIQALTDAMGITNVPDYTHPYDILRALNEMQDQTYYNPGYQFMQYNPLSLQLLGNEQKALNLAALDRATQLAGPNRASRAAYATAAQYAGDKALADALLAGYKANRDQEQRVAEFNNQVLGTIDRGVNNTRQLNAELGVRRAATRESAARLMQTIDDAMAQNRSTNRNTFLENLGTWGKEQQYKNLIDKNPWLLWDSSMNFKGR